MLNELKIINEKCIYVFKGEEAILIKNGLMESMQKAYSWYCVRTNEYGEITFRMDKIISIEYK